MRDRRAVHAASRRRVRVQVTERSPAGTRYSILNGRHRTEQMIDRSRFVCTLEPVDSVDAAQHFVREIEREFPHATHHCWAYVVGAPGSSDRIGLSDDGEPHGTAGRPMLMVLQHSGVGDVAAVVTRYYGGVKLGTGGLVKAYSGAVALALESAPRTQRVSRIELVVQVGYASISAIQQFLGAYEAEIVDQRFDVDAQFRLRCPEEHAEGLRRALMDATRGQAVFSSQ